MPPRHASKHTMQAEPAKPWSVDQFELFRPELCTFVRDRIVPVINAEEFPVNRILIHGDVKAGKREIVEYIAKRDEGGNARKHLFISAFHRRADQSQRDELAKHNLGIYSLSDIKVQRLAIMHITRAIRIGFRVVLHIDECDYGTGERQILNGIWNHFRAHPRVIAILYSATPEELIFSTEIAGEPVDPADIMTGIYETGIRIRYIPPATYCGAAKFVEEGLVENAHRTLIKDADGEYTLSDQFKGLVADFKTDIEVQIDAQLDARRAARVASTPEEKARHELAAKKPVRNIIVLRLSYTIDGTRGEHVHNKKALYVFIKHAHTFPELADVTIIVDKGEESLPQGRSGGNIFCESIQWDNPAYWRAKNPHDPIIIVIDQKSTRSTEWAFHDRVYAYHDYRNEYTYNTIAQAQLRVAHYVGKKYPEFQRIRVFGHKKTFLLAAGRISADEYITNEYSMRKVNNTDTYKIVRSGGGELPEEYRGTYTKEDALHILEVLGCSAEPTLSARVKSRSFQRRQVETTFIPCTAATFAAAIAEFQGRDTTLPHLRTYGFRSPYREDKKEGGLYQGVVRSTYRVYQYSEVEADRFWGMSVDYPVRRVVCYRDGVEGVCVQWITSEWVLVADFKTYKSMYVSEGA